MSRSKSSSDLSAAAASARTLASAALAVCGLRAMGASETTIQRLLADMNQLYPSARATIARVVVELRRTRTAAVRLGDIAAPTAHEAALEMVRALNRERWADFEIVGQRNVQNWPDRNTVMAEIELETTKAKLFMEAESNSTDTAAESDQPSMEQHLHQLAQAVGDENAARILAIVQRSDLTGEEKMEEVLRLDFRFVGKNSGEWGKLLGVTPDAVRGYELWKLLQKAKKSDEGEKELRTYLHTRPLRDE